MHSLYILLNIYIIDSANFEQGYKRELKNLESYKIEAGSLEKETHFVKVEQINLTSKQVTISVSSNHSITIVMDEGDEEKVDVDQDDIYDILIRFVVIKAEKAEIFIKSISEVMTEEPSQGFLGASDIEGNEALENLAPFMTGKRWIVIIAVFLTLLVIGIVAIKGRKEAGV